MSNRMRVLLPILAFAGTLAAVQALADDPVHLYKPSSFGKPNWAGETWATSSTATAPNASYQDDAVLHTFANSNPNIANPVVRGLVIEGTGFCGNSGTLKQLSLGAEGVSIPSNGGKLKFHFYGNGAAHYTNVLHLAASQSWRSSGSTSGTIYLNEVNTVTSGTSPVTAADDVRLTIEQLIVYWDAAGRLGNATVEVGTKGHLYVGATTNFTGHLNAGRLVVDGGAVYANVLPEAADGSGPWTPAGAYPLAETLEVRNGGFVKYEKEGVALGFSNIVVSAGGARLYGTVDYAGVHDLTIASGATFTNGLSSLLAFPDGGFRLFGGGTYVQEKATASSRILSIDPGFTGSIRVAAGGLTLPPMADWPAGLTVDVAAGAFVELMSFEGFDRSRLTGSGELIDDPDVDRETYYASLTSGQVANWHGEIWTNAAGTRVAWKQDRYASARNASLVPNLFVRSEIWSRSLERAGVIGMAFGNGPAGLRLGPGGLVVSGSIDARFDDRDALLLGASQIWRAADDTVTRILTLGSVAYAGATIRARDGVTLTMSGRLTVNFDFYGKLRNADIAVVSPCVLNIGNNGTPVGRLNARKLTVSGANARAVLSYGDWLAAGEYGAAETVVLADGGTVDFGSGSALGCGAIRVSSGTGAVRGYVRIADGGGFTADSGATLDLQGTLLPASARDTAGRLVRAYPLAGAGAILSDVGDVRYDVSGFTGALTVTSGRVELPAMADWPSGMTVSTAAGCVFLAGPEGFDASKIGGTGHVSYYVDDTPVTASTYEIPDGCMLVVAGSGLSEATGTTLVLNNCEVLFVTNAVVASPVTVRGLTRVMTANDSVTGTFAGFVTLSSGGTGATALDPTGASIAASLDSYGPGTVVLAGGGRGLVREERLGLYGGSMVVSNGTFTLGPAASSACNWGPCLVIADAARLFRIADGGRVNAMRCTKYESSLVYVYGADEPILEIGDGGILKVGFHCALKVGTITGMSGKVRVTSGGCLDSSEANNLSQAFGSCASDTACGTLELCEGGVMTNASSLVSVSSAVSGSRLKGGIVFDGGRLVFSSQAWKNLETRTLFTSLRTGVTVTEKGGTLDFSAAPAAIAAVTNAISDAASAAWEGPGCLRLVGRPAGDLEFVVLVPDAGDGSSAPLPFGIGLASENMPVRFVGHGDAVRMAGFEVFGDAGAAVSLENATALEVADATVAEGGVWNNKDFCDWSWFSVSNLTFATGSSLGVTPEAGGLVASMTLLGSLAFAEEIAFRLERGFAQGGAMLFAVSSELTVTPPETWTHPDGFAKRRSPRLREGVPYVLELDDPNGCILVVR